MSAKFHWLNRSNLPPMRWLDDFRAAPFHIQMRRLRRVFPVIVLLLAAIHQMIVNWLVDPLVRPTLNWTELLAYALTGSLAICWDWAGLPMALLGARKQRRTCVRLTLISIPPIPSCGPCMILASDWQRLMMNRRSWNWRLRRPCNSPRRRPRL